MSLYVKGSVLEFKDKTQFFEDQFSLPTNLQYIEHIVKDSETLFSIANEYYRSTFQWHIIAEANDIVDVVGNTATTVNGEVTSIYPGLKLIIPVI